jgi:uncharacterized membrane protein YedE/YeeE
MKWGIRVSLWLAALVAWLAVVYFAGVRQGLLFLVGIGLGAVLMGFGFGFTTGWRAWILDRDPKGLLAQFVTIGLTMLVAIPLIAAHPELSAANAPLSVSLLIGAFIFGAAMQVADGCGSGTLFKVGQGHIVAYAVLPGFIFSSFLGAAHLDVWLRLGSLAPVSLPSLLGAWPTVVLQAAIFMGLALLLWRKQQGTETRWRGKGVYLGAVLLAGFALLNLIVAGQPWGIVYGLGLWGAKLVSAAGWDLSANAFWGREAQQTQIHGAMLDDVTTITNLGLLVGAFLVAQHKGKACPAVKASGRQWLAAALAGLILGYSARLAFGCNVGAYFSGIATGSLHGWVWFAAAFAGSYLGVRLRQRLGYTR